jgi:hypothetical protein
VITLPLYIKISKNLKIHVTLDVCPHEIRKMIFGIVYNNESVSDAMPPEEDAGWKLE